MKSQTWLSVMVFGFSLATINLTVHAAGACDEAKNSFQRDLTAATNNAQGKDSYGCALMRVPAQVWGKHRATIASLCLGTADFDAMMQETDAYVAESNRRLASSDPCQ